MEGDIHDIGKNLVALMLRNYGYHVIDLGKDVSAEVIVSTAIQENAAVIGLSALMTTTMMRMQEVVQLAKEKITQEKLSSAAPRSRQDLQRKSERTVIQRTPRTV